MNSRIRELADRALDKTVPGTWTALDYEQIQKLQEEFAKLIIKEVCNELEISKNADPYTGEVFDTPRNTVLNEQIDWLKCYFRDEDERG